MSNFIKKSFKIKNRQKSPLNKIKRLPRYHLSRKSLSPLIRRLCASEGYSMRSDLSIKYLIGYFIRDFYNHLRIFLLIRGSQSDFLNDRVVIIGPKSALG